MTVVKPKGTATIEDLLNMPDDGQKHELVDGEILVSPTGVRHSEVAGKILHAIAAFLEKSPVGKVHVRQPPVAGRDLRAKREASGKSPDTFGEFVPDLVVEVLSPNDSLRQIAASS